MRDTTLAIIQWRRDVDVATFRYVEKTVYCHVGVHRAGSSFLQTTLALNRALLAGHGVSYVDKYQFGKTPAFRHLQNLWDKDLDRAVDLDAARSDFQELIGGQPGTSIVLSHENLLGRLYSGQGLYPVAERLIARLQELCHPHHLRLIVIVRNQVDFIESVYLWRTMLGSDLDIKKYLAKIGDERHSWLDVLTRIEPTTGRSNLLVMPFEIVYGGSQDLVRAFLALAGVHVTQDVTLSDVQNPSLSDAALRIQVFAGPLLDDADRYTLRQFLQRHFPQSKYGRPVVLNDAQKASLRNRHSAANESMFERFVDAGLVSDRIRRMYCA